MSDINPTEAGMLELLDDLREDGRRRFIRRRTREELEEILVAAWRERDDAVSLMDQHETEPSNLAREANSHMAQIIERNPREHSVADSLEGDTGTIRGRKRGPASPPAQSRKRTRRAAMPDELGKQSPELLGLQLDHGHEDDEGTRDIAIRAKHEPSSDISSDQDSPSNESSDTESLSAERTQTAAVTKYGPAPWHDIAQLKIYVFIPSSEEQKSTRISVLPAAVRDELKRRFEQFLAVTPPRKRVPALRVTTAAKYFIKPTCIRASLRGDLKNNKLGELVPGSKFDKGGRARHSADDQCIADKMPCACIIESKRAFRIGFVPLPERQRVTEDWKNLKYWVRE